MASQKCRVLQELFGHLGAIRPDAVGVWFAKLEIDTTGTTRPYSLEAIKGQSWLGRLGVRET